MSELITLYTFIMCGLLCVTHRKAVFIKAVYMPSDRGSRLLGLDSTVVSVSPKAWAEPSCLLPQGSDGFGFGFGLVLMGCQLGFSEDQALGKNRVSLEAASGADG